MAKRKEAKQVEVVTYTLEEWLNRFDQEARFLTDMSGIEFVTRAEAGELGRGLNDHWVWSLYSMVNEDERPAARVMLREMTEAKSGQECAEGPSAPGAYSVRPNITRRSK
ncbi:MAG: hypothetical protein OXC99_04115 [Chloroflexi bacterium]|nr:hypothetical protein [Chloroflexota bacterium]